MSSTPPAASEPAAPVLGPVTPVAAPRPAETAPSAIVAEGPIVARVIGFAGLFLFVLGAVVVGVTRWTGTPRLFSEGWGLVFGGIGAALMLYHAINDGAPEWRRFYGVLAALLFLVALVFSLLQGPFDAPGNAKRVGYFLLPWGVGLGVLALVFAVPFIRHETDEALRDVVLNALLGAGGLMVVGSLLAGVFRPEFLTSNGLLLALLGLGFICAYLGQTDTTDGVGYMVGFALGAVGAAALLYAFGRSVFPAVLSEGTTGLRTTKQTLDKWQVAGRALLILGFLGLVVWGAVGRFPMWLRATLIAVGLVCAAVFVTGSFATPVRGAPRAFLVPSGLIMGALGLLFLTVGVCVCSDNVFVTLFRRELASYFLTPIGYLVLGGMVLCEWFGYYLFYGLMERFGKFQRAMPEPIVGAYLLDLIPILCVVLPIPALTMRLLSEEKRSGTLELMFTAPVNEWPVVLSKFFATWLFFVLCWLPAGLFLIALQSEAGQAFDYRPLLSFYAALAVCAAAFVSCGLFFSAVTSNQIIAAVLTFMAMLALVLCYIIPRQTEVLPAVKTFMARLSFIDLWDEALRGQLPLRDVLVWASAAVFGLFISVKVLEARKWN
jgi:ABC-2 type transport system permease protein